MGLKWSNDKRREFAALENEIQYRKAKGATEAEPKIKELRKQQDSLIEESR